MRTLFAVLVVVTVTACKKEEPRPAEAVKQPVEAPKPAAAAAGKRIEMKVTEDGFQPSNVQLKKDEPVTFVVTRVTDATCATELLIAETTVKAELPLNKPVEIAWTPTKSGQVKFGCAMDMMVGGLLVVE